MAAWNLKIILNLNWILFDTFSNLICSQMCEIGKMFLLGKNIIEPFVPFFDKGGCFLENSAKVSEV